MDIKEAFRKYYEKLIVEAVIKSVILGLAAGFLVGGLFTALALIFGFNGLWTIWVSIVFGVLAAGASGVLLYLNRFKPSFHEAASRVDQTGGGLEERMITMLELDGNDTFIAQKQREDGQTKIAGVTPKMMQYKFPLYAFIAVGLAAIFGLSILPYGAAIAINDAKVAEAERALLADEDAIIARLIGTLKSLIVGSGIPKELKDELLAEVATLETKVAAAKTHLEKMDLIRKGVNDIRARLQVAIQEAQAALENPNLTQEEIDAINAAIEAMEGLEQALADAANAAMAEMGEAEIGEPEIGPPMPGPPGPPGPPTPSEVEAMEGQKVPEPASPAGAPDPDDKMAYYDGENIIDGNTSIKNGMDQYNQDYSGRTNDPSLDPNQVAASGDYANQMQLDAPENNG